MKLAYIEAEKEIVQNPSLTAWQENTHIANPKSEWEVLMDEIHVPLVNVKSERDLIEAQMKELEETGRKLLAEEKYELMREAQEIYEKLKEQLKNLK